MGSVGQAKVVVAPKARERVGEAGCIHRNRSIPNQIQN